MRYGFHTERAERSTTSEGVAGGSSSESERAERPQCRAVGSAATATVLAVLLFFVVVCGGCGLLCCCAALCSFVSMAIRQRRIAAERIRTGERNRQRGIRMKKMKVDRENDEADRKYSKPESGSESKSDSEE